jgi:microcin C transport system permease protein
MAISDTTSRAGLRERLREKLAINLSPISQRRWNNFKANRRGYWALWIFLSLFTVTLFAEFIANDKPLLVRYKGELLTPVMIDYPEQKFGGFLAVTDYKDPVILDEISKNGWMIWPPFIFVDQ